MLVEGFLALREAGILKREVDGVLLEAAFFLGSRAFYRSLRELPREERAKLRMTAVSFVNALDGEEETKRAPERITTARGGAHAARRKPSAAGAPSLVSSTTR